MFPESNLFLPLHCYHSGANYHLLLITQGSLERKPIECRYRYINRDIDIDVYMRRFIIRSDSCSYRGWEFLWSAICILKKQESQFCNSVWVQRPGDGCGGQRRAAGISLGVQRSENQKFLCPRAEKRGCPRSRREREFNLPLLFCSVGTSVDFVLLDHRGDAHTCWRGWIDMLY